MMAETTIIRRIVKRIPRLALLFAVLAAPGPGQSPGLSDTQVKAAYLLNFIRFVEWPPAVAAEDPFVMCILGQDPFEGVLDQLLAGETFNGRVIQVQRPRRLGNACHVLYVSPAEPDIPLLLRGAREGMLTVGEGEAFLNAGGMIGFVPDGRHIRFDINQQAAAARGLRISSRLLSVAREVRGRPQ